MLHLNDYLMKNIFKYAFIFLLIAGCKGGRQDASRTAEETVAAFYAAVSQGDFTVARQLCDTVSMADYLNVNEARWEKLRQLDSNAAEIAAILLSSAEIEFGKVEKDADRRIVHYRIDAVRGLKKDKTAILARQEEGEWIVESITDAI